MGTAGSNPQHCRTGYWLRFYIPIDTKQVILEMLFLAILYLLTSPEKTKSKP